MENNNLKNEAGLNTTYRNFFSSLFKELADAIMGIIISTAISIICALISINQSSLGLSGIVSLMATIYSISLVFKIYNILKESSKTLDYEY